MITPVFTFQTIPAGAPVAIPLTVDAMRVNNMIAVSEGTAGVLSFRCKAMFGQWDTPEAPNTLDLSTHKSISFNGVPLEAIEITFTGTGSISVAVVQS